jgi:hypothetical protein
MIGLAGAILVAALSIAASARAYSTYYTCLPGSVTAVVVTNASEYESGEAFALTVYDSKGQELHSLTRGLAAYESTAIFLNDLIEAPDEYSWGLITIDGAVLLHVGVWIGTGSSWLSISNVSSESLAMQELDVAYYWYGADYANTEHRRAGIGLVNPADKTVVGTVYVYSASGELLDSNDFKLAARRSAYFNPETILPVQEDSWGLIDVRVTDPILVVSEYYDSEEMLLDVDIINAPYYLQVE